MKNIMKVGCFGINIGSVLKTENVGYKVRNDMNEHLKHVARIRIG